MVYLYNDVSVESCCQSELLTFGSWSAPDAPKLIMSASHFSLIGHSHGYQMTTWLQCGLRDVRCRDTKGEWMVPRLFRVDWATYFLAYARDLAYP